jgi:hypothetical protein
MFCGSEVQGRGRVMRPGKIDHADMLMRGTDAVDVKKSWRQQGAGSWFRRRRPFAVQFDVQPAFFAGFTQRRLFGIFVQLDMPAERQPLVQGSMMDEQDSGVLDHEDCDSEIDLIVQMRHWCPFGLHGGGVGVACREVASALGGESMPGQVVRRVTHLDTL